MIFETAMADAYAAAWEFVPPEDALVNDWSGYRQRPGGDTDNRSRYTDDTLRTIANARAILSGGAASGLSYVREIKRVFREDGRGGWSRAFRAFLESQKDLPDYLWFSSISPRDTNGALMGAPVMGYMLSASLARSVGELQALVTHNEEAARWAGVLSLTSFLVRNGDGPATLLRSLDRELMTMVGFPNDNLMMIARSAEQLRTPIDMTARRTCAHVIDILSTHNTMRGMMNEVIRRGGDADSVAAAAIGIASLNPDAYVNDLPDWMVRDLENSDPTAHALITELDESLVRYANGEQPCP